MLSSQYIPTLKIRRSNNRLIFNMGIPIPGKDGLYIDTGPRLIETGPRSDRVTIRWAAKTCANLTWSKCVIRMEIITEQSIFARFHLWAHKPFEKWAPASEWSVTSQISWIFSLCPMTPQQTCNMFNESTPKCSYLRNIAQSENGSLGSVNQ